MGIETEFGIAAPGAPEFNRGVSSSLLINAYAGPLRRIRWDYEQESPLRDARGFEPMQPREPTEEDLGLANVILPNGARYYVDHAHPEYSTPECSGPRDLVVHDKAGERVLERSLEEIARLLPPGQRLSVYKNNSDGKGNSYGCHENYLVDRGVPFGSIVRDLTPFFISRQVFTGAGKLGVEGPGADGGRGRYQLTQRADFFEAEVGLETTLKRPIINTRDEPHADPDKYRRLHVIIGDANMCEVATYLKVGTTGLILKMIEDEWLPDLSLDGPVQALHEVGQGARGDSRQRRGPGPVAPDPGRPGGGPPETSPRARLGGQAPSVERLSGARHPVLGRPQARPDRSPVPRRPAGQGPVPQARGGGQGRASGGRGGDRAGHGGAADRYPGLLPRRVHPQVPRRHRGRLVGFGDLRHWQGRPPARPDAGAPPGHAGHGRRAPRPSTRRRHPGRPASGLTGHS